MGVELGYGRIDVHMNLIIFELLHEISFWKILLWCLILCMRIGGLGMYPLFALYSIVEIGRQF